MGSQCTFTGSLDRQGNRLVLVTITDSFDVENELTSIFAKLHEPSQSGQLTFLVDCAGVSLYRHGNNLSLYMQKLRHLNQKYPHSVHLCLLLNANWIVSGLFKLMDSQLTSRVRFIDDFGSLDQYISGDQLPVQYGGCLEDADDMFQLQAIKSSPPSNDNLPLQPATIIEDDHFVDAHDGGSQYGTVRKSYSPSNEVVRKSSFEKARFLLSLVGAKLQAHKIASIVGFAICLACLIIYRQNRNRRALGY